MAGRPNGARNVKSTVAGRRGRVAPLVNSGSQPPKLGFWDFLYATISSDVKTHRLAFLIQQAALGVVFMLTPLAGLLYILAYQAPVIAKISVTCGSIFVVTAGSFIKHLLKRRAPRKPSA
jgi:hypothetical protein